MTRAQPRRWFRPALMRTLVPAAPAFVSTRAQGGMPALLLAVLLVWPALAPAQTIWRCGPDGRSYRDAPCADGREVAAADPRDDGQRAQAQEVAEREQRLAERLQDERRQREREVLAAGGGAAAIRPAAAEAPALEPAVHEPRPAARKRASRKQAPRAQSVVGNRPRR